MPPPLVNPGGLVDILEGGLLTVDGTVANNGALKQTKTATQNTTTSFLNITGTLGTTKYLGLDITLGAAGNMGRTSVAILGNQMCGSAGPLLGLTVGRCYEITPTTLQTATVKFYYRSVEVWGQIAPNAYHFNGSTWDAQSSTRGGSGETMWVQATGVNSYSPFALKDPNIPTYRTYLPLIVR
jgi:hypothetical protein